MILDDEVEQVRGPRLDRRIERLAAERLLDVEQDRLQGVAALLAGQPRVLAACDRVIAEGSDRRPRRPDVERRKRCRGLVRGGRELALVVGAEHPPRPRIPLDDIKDGLPLVGDELLVPQRGREQGTACSISTPRSRSRFSLSV